MQKAWFAALAIGLMAGCAGSTNPFATSGAAAGGAGGSKSNRQRRSAALAELKAPKRSALPVQEPFDPSKATPELYVGLAQVSERSGNIPQARSMYQKALAKDPKHLEALLGAARMEDREGQLNVALMLYQRAATYHPKNASVLNDLALCHARRGELPIAHHVLEQAVQLDPAKPLYRNNVAKVLVELNGLQPAMHHLSAVHAPAVANYNMAVLLSERGRSDEATSYLSHALAIDPTMEPAQIMLAQFASPPTGETSYAAQPAAHTMPHGPVPSRDASESILPTPEAVATMPWSPGMPAATTIYPATGYNPAAGPSLLPPVQ